MVNLYIFNFILEYFLFYNNKKIFQNFKPQTSNDKFKTFSLQSYRKIILFLFIQKLVEICQKYVIKRKLSKICYKKKFVKNM